MYNPFSLEGKTILVTGASSGIGKATAIECSKMGAKVVLTGRNEAKLQQTYDLLMGNGHLMIVADLSCDVDISTIVEKCPSIDGLVNNAGLSIILPTHFITRDKMEQIMSVNTLAPILLMQQLLKKKKLEKNGSVVFTSSISGPVIAGVGNVMYSTSKAAVCGFVKNAALDLASKNIIVILEYNPYPFIIRTLGRLPDFEVTNCQPFLLLYSALICFLGISSMPQR